MLTIKTELQLVNINSYILMLACIYDRFALFLLDSNHT